MRKWPLIIISVSLVFVMVIGACAPKPGPGSNPATIAPTTQSLANSPAVALKTVSNEDAAWQKIVEAAKKEGKVTAYSYNWVGDIGLDVKKTFESRYGITLDIITGRGAEFIERLKTERRLNQRTGDFTEGSAGHITSMKMDGLVISVVTELPALREKDVWWVDPSYLDPVDRVNLTLTQQVDSPTINTNLVKPGEEPGSWKDLLDPKWKGKMGLRDPKLSSLIIAMFVGLVDKKIWDENYMKALHKQDLKYIISTVDEGRLLSQGEIHMSALGSGNGMTRVAAQGAPIRMLTMKEGELVSGISMATIANAPHPNAAKVLMNWVLSKEGQSVIGQGLSALPVRKDVQDFRPPTVRTKMVNPFFVNQANLDEGAKRYQDRWYDKLVGR
ncbi:MAG: iron ABC transporter substrate-binding protein [Dehalococcoidia bacterium]|nr:iron ABC transporter substrate-binding protein [Dehalococcoidia bacterium]